MDNLFIGISNNDTGTGLSISGELIGILEEKDNIKGDT